MNSRRRVNAAVMLLSLINKRLPLIFGVLLFSASVVEADVCDRHLLRIKQIPYAGNSGEDAHYDAIIAAGRSAVPCLIANVTNTRPERNPRPIPSWGGDTMVGDVAIYLLSEVARFDVIKLLPRRYQDLYSQMGVTVMDKYMHDRRSNPRALQRALWRWYRTTYLHSLPKGAT
jgi:hypothetical protein